jgi:hypothetical protein
MQKKRKTQLKKYTMKNLKTVLTITLIVCSSFLMAQRSDSRLNDLFAKQDFFELNKQYPLLKKRASEQFQLFMGAYVNSYFNKPAEANENIRQLYDKYPDWAPEVYHLIFSIMIADNELNMQNYNKMASTYKQIIEQYAPQYDSIFLNSWENIYKMFAPLADVPPMEVTYSKKTIKIPLKQDTHGLLNMPVYTGENNTDTLYFLVDLGSGMSAIEERFAEALKVKILADSILVSDVYDSHYQYIKIGVADELNLGEIQIKNVAFLIFPDRIVADFFPDDEVYALFGLPVMQLLEKIELSKSTLLISPSPKQLKKTQNILLSNGQMFVHTKTQKAFLSMHFDSGRSISMLTQNYLSKTLDTAGLIFKSIDTMLVVDGKEIHHTEPEKALKTDFVCHIGGKRVPIPFVHVETQDYLPGSRILPDGVLGTDLIMNNKKVIIDFKNMYFEVK